MRRPAPRKWTIAACLVLAATAGLALAQGRGGYRDSDQDRYDRRRTDDRNNVPDWENPQGFEEDVFTFVRVQYGDGYGRWGGRRGRRGWGRGGWATDFPDSDLNFSFRLQQLTSMKVSPDPIAMPLTDPELGGYPFLYMIEPGSLYFTDQEVEALRKYLDNGGFLMVDDFWGEREWESFYSQIKRVYPDREAIELPLSHEVFHIVYDLKKKPQVPNIDHWEDTGVTYERWDAQEPHYRAFFDDDDRMTVFICHNTDLGDGWEKEGESVDYFHAMSEKWAYPMGINIVVYAMTH